MECDCENGIIHSFCSACNGSGQGMYDGSTCRECKGRGEVKMVCDRCEAGAQAYLDERDPLDYL